MEYSDASSSSLWISRIGVVAGSRVTEGELRPKADIVVTRDGEEVSSEARWLLRLDEDGRPESIIETLCQ